MGNIAQIVDPNEAKGSEHFARMTEALCYKTQNVCCETPCQNCPYNPQWSGYRGPQHWKPEVRELINAMTVKNAPNEDFHLIPEAPLILARIKEGVATRRDVKAYFISN